MLRIILQAAMVLSLGSACATPPPAEWQASTSLSPLRVAGDEPTVDLEPLYRTKHFVTYYDPAAQQCVVYAAFGFTSRGGGVGLDTFACDVDEVRSRAKELAKK